MPEKGRHTWRVEKVQARDLRDTEVAFIDGGWQEIFDTWTSEGDPGAEFGDDSPLTHEITSMLGKLSTDWIVIRYVDLRESTPSEVAYRLKALPRWDLVDVQVRED